MLELQDPRSDRAYDSPASQKVRFCRRSDGGGCKHRVALAGKAGLQFGGPGSGRPRTTAFGYRLRQASRGIGACRGACVLTRHLAKRSEPRSAARVPSRRSPTPRSRSPTPLRASRDHAGLIRSSRRTGHAAATTSQPVGPVAARRFLTSNRCRSASAATDPCWSPLPLGRHPGPCRRTDLRYGADCDCQHQQHREPGVTRATAPPC